MGGGEKAAKQGKSPLTTKMQPFIRRLSALNKRCRILNVDAKKCKKYKIRPSFDQVMTYLAKYDFVILSEV